MRGVFIFIIMQLCYNKNDYTLRILENACEDVFLGGNTIQKYKNNNLETSNKKNL